MIPDPNLDARGEEELFREHDQVRSRKVMVIQKVRFGRGLEKQIWEEYHKSGKDWKGNYQGD